MTVPLRHPCYFRGFLNSMISDFAFQHIQPWPYGNLFISTSIVSLINLFDRKQRNILGILLLTSNYWGFYILPLACKELITVIIIQSTTVASWHFVAFCGDNILPHKRIPDTLFRPVDPDLSLFQSVPQSVDIPFKPFLYFFFTHIDYFANYATIFNISWFTFLVT